MDTITYYDRPIKRLSINEFNIDYCKWENDYRLISVNHIPHNHLSNYMFSYFLELVINSERV
jgi:hypothetical protein